MGTVNEHRGECRGVAGVGEVPVGAKLVEATRAAPPKCAIQLGPGPKCRQSRRELLMAHIQRPPALHHDSTAIDSNKRYASPRYNCSSHALLTRAPSQGRFSSRAARRFLATK